MVTPPPVIITQESGRTLEFELGRMEIPQVQVEEGAEPPPTPNPDQEKVFVSYPFDQSADTLKSWIDTNEGVVLIEGLQYTINEKFTGGKYEIIVRDKTTWVGEPLPEIRISLEIVNPDEAPVAAKGKKK